MRKIIGSVFLSLDGVMQAPGGPTEDPTGGFAHGGWMFGFFDEGVGAAIHAFFDRPYDLLLGRRTYDIFAGYWPYATGENAAMGEAFTRAGKHVLTRGRAPLAWVAALKGGDGPDLLIQGSSTIYPELLRHGLLDQLTVMVFPVLLGAGKRPFGEATPAATLRMTDHQVTPGGVVIATYQPAGPIEVGSFAPGEPSVEEIERQRRMAEDSW